MRVENLTVDQATCETARSSMVVSLAGVSGADFVACAEQKLIDEILDALGEDAVREHFGIAEE